MNDYISLEGEEKFVDEHRELANLVPQMIGTYTVCPLVPRRERGDNLWKVYDHMFGTPETVACVYCSVTMQAMMSMDQRFKKRFEKNP